MRCAPSAVCCLAKLSGVARACQKGISPELCATWLSPGKRRCHFLGMFCLFSCVWGKNKGMKKNRAQPWYACKSGKSPGQRVLQGRPLQLEFTKSWPTFEQFCVQKKSCPLAISCIFSHLVPLYCAIPRDYLSDTPYCALWGFECLNMANWVRYPLPPFLSVSPLESLRSGGAIPPLKRAKGVSQRFLRDTL